MELAELLARHRVEKSMSDAARVRRALARALLAKEA